MNEKLTSIISGSTLGFIGGLTTDKIVEVIILSFVGGVVGALGHWVFKRIKIFFKNRNNKRII